MADKQQAEIVIVGGGAVGCGVAYQLALAGQTDVLLLESLPSMAAATTAQAAGLVGQLRTSIERTQLAMWSVETFSQLEQDEIAKPGWRQVGSLRVALNAERVKQFQQMKAVADSAGLEVEFIDNQQAAEFWPTMSFDQAQAVLWCATDGYLQPSDLTMAYVSQCRRQGIEFQTDTTVQDVVVRDGRVQGVVTNRGTIDCSLVINAAGAHAYQLAASVGLQLPIIPVRHEYFVTVQSDGLHPQLPVMRIPDATLYLRAETGAMLCGGWEPASLSTDPREYPVGKEPPVIEPDWDVLAEFAAQLAPHFPAIEELGIRSVFKGWPTFTPDGRFIIGPSSQLEGFYMAGGCNAHGVSGSAGIGRHVVESILSTDPGDYLKSLSPDRFGDWDWQSARQQAMHYYETYYALEH